MNQSEYYLYTLHLSVWLCCYGYNIQNVVNKVPLKDENFYI